MAFSLIQPQSGCRRGIVDSDGGGIGTGPFEAACQCGEYTTRVA